jgi:hypothetical protein
MPNFEPTIICPYSGDEHHKFQPETRELKDGRIVHYCGHCLKAISVENPPNKRALGILYRLSVKFGLEE